MSAPEIPHDAIVNQKQGQAVLIWAVGAYCVFGWEWIICLPQEYRRVWRKPITLPSFLYLVNRYFGLIQFSFVISIIADAWGPESCKHVFYWEPVGALISTVVSQMILGTRIYAIFEKNKVVGALLLTILVVEVAIGGYSVSTTAPPPNVPGPGTSKPPCGAVMGPRGWLIAFWSIPLLYDFLVFLLTAIKAFEYWKKEVTAPLFSVIWRDGTLYFFTIFIMNATNILIFLMSPTSLRAVNLTPTLILEVILSCRLYLNLRGIKGDLSFNPGSSLRADNWHHLNGPTTWSTDNTKFSTPSQSYNAPSAQRGIIKQVSGTTLDTSTPEVQPVQLRLPVTSANTFDPGLKLKPLRYHDVIKMEV